MALQDRVKGFIKKIKDAEELANGPSLKLDKDASKRFINSALSRDQVYAEALDERKKQEAEKAPPATKRTAPAAKSSDKKKRRKN
jgi:hypothetical protein